MDFNHAIIGGGLSGIVSLEKIISTAKNLGLKKNLKICLIDKDIDLLCGGVAYSIKTSQSGFFNNPLRLSHTDYSNWISKPKNLLKLRKYFDHNSSPSEKKWFNLYFKKLLNRRNVSEIYMPRPSVYFWLSDLFKKSLNNIQIINSKSTNKIILKVINVEIKKIKKINNHYKIKIKNKYFTTNSISLSTGLPPPEKFTKSPSKLSRYMWDFYSEGSTKKLLELIKSIKKKNIKIFFIGFKAGLLEPLMEIKDLILKKKKKIKILAASMTEESLQPAIHSKNFENYKLKYLTTTNISKIKNARNLFDLVKKELTEGPKKKYKKYDAWTKILSKHIIDKGLKKLNKTEINKYNNIYHSQIRSLTRFTYPEAVHAKDYLLKKGIIKTVKASVKEIKNQKNNILINLIKKNKKTMKINSDIVVNVSGPKNIETLEHVFPLIDSLKKIAKTDTKGFLINKNFEISKNFYSPGILSSGFNPARKTIFKAIIDNSKKVAAHVVRNYV